jgi:hypothetical protein
MRAQNVASAVALNSLARSSTGRGGARAGRQGQAAFAKHDPCPSPRRDHSAATRCWRSAARERWPWITRPEWCTSLLPTWAQWPAPTAQNPRARSTTPTSLHFRINGLRAVWNSVSQNAFSNAAVPRCDLYSASYRRRYADRRDELCQTFKYQRSLTGILLSRAHQPDAIQSPMTAQTPTAPARGAVPR